MVSEDSMTFQRHLSTTPPSVPAHPTLFHSHNLTLSDQSSTPTQTYHIKFEEN